MSVSHRKPIPDPAVPLPPPAVPLLRAPLLPLQGGDGTHHLFALMLGAPVPIRSHPAQPGRNMLAPYGAFPVPAGVINLWQLVGVCGRVS